MGKFCPIRAAFGKEAEEKTVELLRSVGINAKLQPPLEVAPNELRRYSEEQFDIIIELANGRSVTVEVKRRTDNYHFTSVADFPFSTVIVDTAKTFDAKRIKPLFYVVWNADLTAAMLIFTNTEQWRTNCDDGEYLCPIELCYDFMEELPKLKDRFLCSEPLPTDSVSECQHTNLYGLQSQSSQNCADVSLSLTEVQSSKLLLHS
jgi:hypothetical protein